jgi:hypothetical protein
MFVPIAGSCASEIVRERMSVKFNGLCEVPAAGVLALYAFGFEEIGVCVGVWLNGMYFWPVDERPSMPAGLLREWLWCVLEREGGCDDCAYCCEFVWIGCGCMLGVDAGTVELGADDLTLAPAPGCKEPGTLLIPAPALDGRIAGGREPEPE